MIRNVVSCGRCGDPFSHEPYSSEDLKCPHCGFEDDPSSFPDVNLPFQFGGSEYLVKLLKLLHADASNALVETETMIDADGDADTFEENCAEAKRLEGMVEAISWLLPGSEDESDDE